MWWMHILRRLEEVYAIRHSSPHNKVTFATRGKLTFMVRGSPFQHSTSAPRAPDKAAAWLELLAVDGLGTVHVHVPLWEKLARWTGEGARGILRRRRRSLKRECRALRRGAITQLEHCDLVVDLELAACQLTCVVVKLAAAVVSVE